MALVRSLLAPFATGWQKKEWEGVVITAAAVALWFFQRFAKWPRGSGGFMVRSLFLYVLIPFALHALFTLEGKRKRYAGLALGLLSAGMLATRFVLEPADARAWAVLAGGLALSAPLFVFCSPRELGVRGGELRLWLPLVAVGWVVTLAGIVAIAHTPSFLKSYPYVPLRAGDFAGWALREGLEVIDMFAWEFLFRGFLLFALAPRLGVVSAILIQATLFGCAHVGKPEIEVYASILGGILLGHLCWRVRSMLPAFAAHQAIFLSAEIAGVWVKLGR